MCPTQPYVHTVPGTGKNKIYTVYIYIYIYIYRILYTGLYPWYTVHVHDAVATVFGGGYIIRIKPLPLANGHTPHAAITHNRY
jgi:hypothetical protein